MNKYLLLGFGQSNQAVKRFFDQVKIPYLIYDDYNLSYKGNIDFNSFQVIIKSPGIKNDHWILDIARKLKKEIISDLELFYRFNRKRKIITVTGTNGKTTTVNILKEILPNYDLAGNCGYPLLDFTSNLPIIIEASSFMLEYLNEYHSEINVFLNISSHHLDHHQDFNAYLDAKLNLLKNINKEDLLIYNYDDPVLRNIFKDYQCLKLPFSLEEEQGIYYHKGAFYYQNQKLMETSNLKLLGRHNLRNIAAALAVGTYLGIKVEELASKINNFKPLEHRLELLGKIEKLEVYNDSKATNSLALNTALSAFSGKRIILICGGKTSEGGFSLYDEVLKSLVLVLINGENREVLKNYFNDKKIPYRLYSSLETLLNNLKALPEADILLFSPGAVSYDQFSSFEERGSFFKERMKHLISE